MPPLIKGNVLILTGPNSFDPQILDLEETIKNELSELNGTLDSDTDMIQKQIGELCVLENATENSFRRYVFLYTKVRFDLEVPPSCL